MTKSQDNSRVSLLELLGAALGSGALCGTLYALMDSVYHAPRLGAWDWLVAVGFAVIPAISVFVVLAVWLRISFALFGLPLTRRLLVASLAFFAFVGLLATFVLAGTNSLRNVRGLLLLMMGIPFSACAAALISKWPVVLRPWRTLTAGMTTALIFLIAMAVLGVLRGRSSWVSGVKPGVEASNKSAVGNGEARPHVVMIVLDTTRRDMLGCYGHPGGLTPVLDGFAAKSTIYEGAFSPAPWTVPAHASLFTGLYPTTHGCSYEQKVWLDDEFETLAERLKDVGYHTLALTSNSYLKLCNLLQGFEHKQLMHGAYDDLSMHAIVRQAGMPEHWVDKGSAEVVGDLGKLTKLGVVGPWFLFINLLEAHGPYLPPYAERCQHLPTGAGYWETTRFNTNLELEVLHARGTTDSRTKTLTRSMYEAQVRYQDRRLGEILSLIERLTRGEPTLVIVTADHGEDLGEAGRWGHAFSLSDHLTHVPLIIRFPDTASAGARVPGLCSLVDIFPTVMESAGLALPVSGFPGRSLSPAAFQPRSEVFMELDPFLPMLTGLELRLGFRSPVVAMRTARKAIRTEEWKFISAANGLYELYDLTLDLEERDNLTGFQPAVEADLHGRLTQWRQETNSYQPKPTESAGSEELQQSDVERLRGLGYVR